jgi:hypothetical protein
MFEWSFKYPKIQSLWKRDKTKKGIIIPGQYTMDIFERYDHYNVIEKVDGLNVRALFDEDSFSVEFGSRTSKSLPKPLLEHLDETLGPDNIWEIFSAHIPEEQLHDPKREKLKVVLFGEGYGQGIRKGGEYQKEQRFVLFDVWVNGWWLELDNIIDVAKNLGIRSVPVIYRDAPKSQIIEFVKMNPDSLLAEGSKKMEGVIARMTPELLLRKTKTPVVWKLKYDDYKRYWQKTGKK